MKQIEVQYYGALRELFGTASETLSSEAHDCQGLWIERCAARGMKLGIDGLRVAVDDAFANWSTPLSGNNTVAFMPPFAGG